VTNAQKAALGNAREAVAAMSAEEPTFKGGSIRSVPGGYDIRLSTEAGVFLVRTSADGAVVAVAEEEVH
jgi:hypothetical protein